MNGEMTIYESATYDMGLAFSQSPTSAAAESAFLMAKDYYTNIATNNRDRAQVKLAYKRFIDQRKVELPGACYWSPDALKVPESAPTSPVEPPEVEHAQSWLNAWLDDEPAPIADKIADLRTKWQQALAHLEAVAAEHDLTLAGNLKFNMASKMAVIARDDLYYAESAASRQAVTA